MKGNSIDNLLKNVRRSTFNVRLRRFSQLFIGCKYLDNPVGDGPDDPLDPRPYYNHEKFDCLTFIESAISLSLSKNRNEFLQNILALRYSNSKPSFLNRNHFLHTQWIPKGVRKCFFQEITDTLVAKKVLIRKAEKLYPTKRFLRDMAIDYPHISQQTIARLRLRLTKRKSSFIFSLIPLNSFFVTQEEPFMRIENLSLLSNIPDCSILAFYFKDHDHIGLLIKTGSEYCIRHVGVLNRIYDEPLLKFLVTLEIVSNCEGVRVLRCLPSRTAK